MSKSFADDFMKEFEELILPQEVSSRFNVIERLSQNDYGETFLLAEKDGGKRYVLKCYKKSDTLSVVHEAELLSGLEHKGLPRFETEIENEDTLFILREYVEGVPLEQYLAEHQVDETQAVNILMQLCEILAYLHSQPAPIIHRDIKPSNIIINSRDNALTLIDFGISRKYDKDAETDTAFFGTQKFAPPEQYGFSQTDCRADVYALGVVMRYMLAGTADRKTSIKDKSLERIAAKCAAFSPSERYQSAVALKKTLMKYKGRVKQKVFFAAASVFAACLVFVAGFAVGRYTDILRSQSYNPYNMESMDGVDSIEGVSNVDKADIPQSQPETPNNTDKADSPNENIMVFTEPLIEKAVRLTLGKEDGQPVTRDELKNINTLYIVGEEVAASQKDWEELLGSLFSENKPQGNIKSLTDLNSMENLIEIHIAGQPLSDLSPLAANIRLSHIRIMHCTVSDVSPLISLPHLIAVELFDNQISDFSVFENMKALKELGVGKSVLENISELGDIPNIESLNLHETKITSLDGIEKFPILKRLSVVATNVRDFSALDELPRLEVLLISDDMEQYLNTLSREDIDVVIQ